MATVVAGLALPASSSSCCCALRLPSSGYHYVASPGLSSSSSSSSLLAARSPQLIVRTGGKLASEVKEGRRRSSVSMLVNAVTNGREDVAVTAPSEYVPAADFYKVEAVVRPWRLSHVASSLIDVGIRGVTVADVRGFGSQGGSRERHGGSEFSEDSFVAKVKLEVVVSKDQVEVVVDTIIDQARTGEIGDGKIFISPVADIVRVRTGERGLFAERMIGGRAESLSGAKAGQSGRRQ